MTAFLSDEHCVTFKEWYGTHVQDVEQVERIARWIEEMREGRRRTGRAVWEIRECVADLPPGSRREHGLAESVYEVYETRLGKLGIPVRPMPHGRGTRKAGLQRVLGALEAADDGFPHWQVTTACPNLIRTVPELPQDPNNPDDLDTTAEDHAFDSMKGLFLARPAGPKGATWPIIEPTWPGTRADDRPPKPLRLLHFVGR